MADVSSALTQAVQPDPWISRRGDEIRTWRGFDVETNTESSLSWTNCLTSGGGSGGGGSLANGCRLCRNLPAKAIRLPSTPHEQ